MFLNFIGPFVYLIQIDINMGGPYFSPLQLDFVSTSGVEGKVWTCWGRNRGDCAERTGQWGVQRAPEDSGVSLLTVAGLWPQPTFLHSGPLLLLLDFVVSLWACVRDLFLCHKRLGYTGST